MGAILFLGAFLICCLVRDASSDAQAALLPEIARACSPRVEVHGDRVVVFDASGLGRVIGTPEEIGREVQALAAGQGLTVRVALAPTRAGAWLLAHAHPGVTVVDAAQMKKQIGALSLDSLRSLGTGLVDSRRSLGTGPVDSRRALEGEIETLRRWGLKTLGQVAALPRSGVHTRLGWAGVRLHQAALGEDADPLVPAGIAPAFLERMQLEWPIEGLEPLAFVLSRQLEALSISLERADRGAIAITTSLRLVTRTTHERTLTLPAPMRDARTLRTLILLDLESHPPPAGIDAVTVSVEVAPGRITQGSLLERAYPAAEHLTTLMARLRALAGESRVNAPAVLDTHDARDVGMQPFAVTPACPVARPAVSAPDAAAPCVALRRFRLPIAARVMVERGSPVRVMPATSAIPAGRVIDRAGPWRSSGRWWTASRANWDRDEWDVELSGGGCYRLVRDRANGNWAIEGEID